MNNNTSTRPGKRLIIILFIATILLMAPLIAMLFTGEVKWSPADFLVAGILLFGTGFTIEFILRKVQSPAYRLTAALLLIILLILVWLELAVGIFGTPFGGH